MLHCEKIHGKQLRYNVKRDSSEDPDPNDNDWSIGSEANTTA